MWLPVWGPLLSANYVTTATQVYQSSDTLITCTCTMMMRSFINPTVQGLVYFDLFGLTWQQTLEECGSYRIKLVNLLLE